MSFHCLKNHMKRVGTIFISLSCTLGVSAFCMSGSAHADEVSNGVTVKKVDLNDKILNGIVETKESVVFAAPSSIEKAEMRYIQIAQYKAEPSEKGEEIFSGEKMSGLIAKYLQQEGYKGFSPENPLRSELEEQKFIFDAPKADLGKKAEDAGKAKLAKTDEAFASYLVKEAEEKEVASSPIPLTYSPTHPAAVAPLTAGGYVFYSANGTFAPQIVFTDGAKVANLPQQNLVELSPAKKENSNSEGAEKDKKKDEKKALKKPAATKTASDKKAKTAPVKTKVKGAAEVQKTELASLGAPVMHVLDTGLSSPNYTWSESGTWITNPEDLSFNVGEMNPISYQVITPFPTWEQMSTFWWYSMPFVFTVTPGAGESVMLNSLQVGGMSISQINQGEGKNCATVSWNGQTVSNLNQTVEGNGEAELQVSLNWDALSYLRWNGAAVNSSDGSSEGYDTLSIYHSTYFALNFIGYLNLDAQDTPSGIGTSASITSVVGSSLGDAEYSPASSVNVYTNGDPNGSGDWNDSASFHLEPESGLDNSTAYGGPTASTSNAGLWWYKRFPKGSCQGEITQGAQFTVATLAKTLYTGPDSTPSKGIILSNGEAYLEPTGTSSDPLNTAPDAGAFAGWSYGTTPVAFSSVYAGAQKPSESEDTGLFEIGGIANGVYIVSETALAKNSNETDLPSFYITVEHGSPDSFSDTKDGENISYGQLDPSTGTLTALPFCPVKALPLTGGKGLYWMALPAASLVLLGMLGCGVWLSKSGSKGKGN